MNKNLMTRLSLRTACALAFCCSVSTAQAAGVTSAGLVTFDWATVGNAGNAADTTGYGAVDYEYQIATTEVTNAQYATFLNAVASTDSYGLYNTNMASTYGGIIRSGTSGSYTYTTKTDSAGSSSSWADSPVNYVSWYDAARFTNWLHNGQGSGDTETGAYDMSASTITRSSDARYFLPNENEWYKAAYHDASAGTDGVYFDYATGSDTAPASATPSSDPSGANYYDGGYVNWTGSGSNPLTDVGSYTDAASPYGTFDQNGNVWEWNETSIGSSRGLRGGSWSHNEVGLRSSYRSIYNPTYESSGIGFRVASPAAVTAVPSPTAALAGVAMLTGMAMRRRRR